MRLVRRIAAVAVIVVGTLVPAGITAAVPVSAHETLKAGASGGASSQKMALLAPQSTMAQLVDVSPSTEGMPGAELIRKLLSWLSQLALWGSLGSILAGATVYGLAQSSANYNGAYRGKQLAVAGAIGAALAGLAPSAITMLFRAAGG